MDDYIKRESAVKIVKELFSLGDCYCDEQSIVGHLNMIPSADVISRDGVQKWIPIAKQLPEFEKEVLVCVYGSLVRVWCLQQQHKILFWETEDGMLDDFFAVTHWMPLPQPPEREV